MSEIERLSPAWQKLFRRAQMSSQQQLAGEAELSKATVNRMVRGIGRPDVNTVRRVADVLADGDTDVIWTAIGTGHRDYGDFDLTEVADDLPLLTPSQRTAVLALIRSMVDPAGKRRSLTMHTDVDDQDLHVASDAETGP